MKKEKHSCVEKLLKEGILYQVKWNQGVFEPLSGITIENKSDQDIYVLILEEKE